MNSNKQWVDSYGVNMKTLIDICNNNEGFVSAILSCTTIIISVIAIFISIRTAKLPFRKKLKLSGSIGLAIGEGIESAAIDGYYVSACNVGNRAVNISFLGLALDKNNKRNRKEMDLFHNIRASNKSETPLMPTETFDVKYDTQGLVSSLLKQNLSRNIYLYASDTEGGIIKKKLGTVEQFLKQFE